MGRQWGGRGNPSTIMSNSGSASPLHLEVDVVAKSCVRQNNLHESSDSNESGAGEARAIKTAATQPASSSASSSGYTAQGEVNLGDSSGPVKPPVKMLAFGFITQIADYMVADNVIIRKASPGTIMEAASLSLPVMLTSFMPGQDEDTVDSVVDRDFGTFISNSDPEGISDVVAG